MRTSTSLSRVSRSLRTRSGGAPDKGQFVEKRYFVAKNLLKSRVTVTSYSGRSTR